MASGCSTVLGDLYLVTFVQSIASTVAATLGRQSLIVRHLRPVYEWLLHLLTAGKGIPWVINGSIYRIDPRHRHRVGHEYDVPVAEFLRKNVRPGDVCLNVGANVGVYVFQFCSWSAPDGQVFAFEPNPTTVPVLRRHIDLNDLGDRVRIVPVAVGDKSDQETLYAAAADGMSRLGSPNPLIGESASPISVTVVTLDEYCEEHGLVPDWIFMDIEGFEIRALMGARRLIQQCASRLQIILEMHPNSWESAGTSREHFEDLIATFDRHVIPLTGQVDPWRDHGLVYLRPYAQK
jgi:FkbM family methyltransferase